MLLSTPEFASKIVIQRFAPGGMDSQVGTLVGGDGFGLSVALPSLRTHTILVFSDVIDCSLP